MGNVRAHTKYTLADGSVIPSVTTIIGDNLGWNKNALLAWVRREALAGRDPDRVKEAAAEIGTLAHAMIEERVKRMLGVAFNEVDPRAYSGETWERARVAFTAFLAWEETQEVAYLASEVRMVSEWWHYGGTLDVVATVGGVLSLLDIKTSNGLYPEHRIQLAAYRQLWRENNGEWLVPHLIQLGKTDGAFHHHALGSLDKEWEAFMILLRLNQLRREAFVMRLRIDTKGGRGAEA